MSRPLYPQERSGTHCIGGWMGPRASLDGCGKSCPHRFDPRTVQPVENRYTDWALPAHCRSLILIVNCIVCFVPYCNLLGARLDVLKQQYIFNWWDANFQESLTHLLDCKLIWKTMYRMLLDFFSAGTSYCYRCEPRTPCYEPPATFTWDHCAVRWEAILQHAVTFCFTPSSDDDSWHVTATSYMAQHTRHSKDGNTCSNLTPHCTTQHDRTLQNTKSGVGILRHACQAWHAEWFSMARWVIWNTVIMIS
jgi:hypothetical protein